MFAMPVASEDATIPPDKCKYCVPFGWCVSILTRVTVCPTSRQTRPTSPLVWQMKGHCNRQSRLVHSASITDVYKIGVVKSTSSLQIQLMLPLH